MMNNSESDAEETISESSLSLQHDLSSGLSEDSSSTSNQSNSLSYSNNTQLDDLNNKNSRVDDSSSHTSSVNDYTNSDMSVEQQDNISDLSIYQQWRVNFNMLMFDNAYINTDTMDPIVAEPKWNNTMSRKNIMNNIKYLEMFQDINPLDDVVKMFRKKK